LRKSLKDLRHPLLIEALVNGLWQPYLPNWPIATAPLELRIGLQLANRAGAVSSEQYAYFTGAIEAFAEVVSGAVQFEPAEAVLGRAQQIDQFAADVDMEVVLSAVKNSGEPFTHAEFDRLAGELGLVPQASAYVSQNAAGGMVYIMRPEVQPQVDALQRGNAFHKLSFALDVPHVAEGRNAWSAMLDAANRVCVSVDARLVDDTDSALTPPGLDKLQRLIDRAQEQLAARGVPAGSKVARRLFS
jgi:hypothetical protein